MATQVKHRRGTQSEIDAFTGAIGEIVVNTTEEELVLNNGATQGGIPIAKKRNTVLSFDNLSVAIANTSLKSGYSIQLKERITGNGGGALWDVVSTLTVTPNGFNIVQCTGVPGLALSLRIDGDLKPRQWGAYGNGTNATETTDALQACIDYLRKLAPLAGDNFNLDYASRGVIDLEGKRYLINKPLLIEEDVVEQLFATGITIKPNKATVIADPSFTGVTRIKDDQSNTVVIKSAIIVGVKDYATQSGRYVSFINIDDLNVDGGGVLTSALYEDVASHNQYNGWQVNNCDYGLTGKVTFLSSYHDWKLYNCNGTVNFNNTSLNDGYNSGNGLEGGGITFGDWTITGDNGSAQPRLYMNKIGEFKFTSFTSYQGLGDGIVIERNPADSPTGSRWNQLGRVEIGDLGGRPLILTNASFIQCTDFIVVKDGLDVPLDAALMSIAGCGDITLRGFDIDQFYDFDPSLTWGSVLDVVDSARIKIEVNNARSIPATNNAYSMFRFRGTSQTCELILGTLTQAVGPRLYQSPVSSEATCTNIKVKGITTQAGAYVSSTPQLLGAGDSWDEITNEFGKAPVSGLKSRVAVTAEQNLVQNFEIASLRKAISHNTLTDLAVINFNGSTFHNALIEVDICVQGDSSYCSRTEKRKIMFNRNIANAGVATDVELTAEELNYSGSPNYTVDGVTVSYVATQFSLAIKVTGVFGGGVGDTDGVVFGTVTVRSRDDFDLTKQ